MTVADVIRRALGKLGVDTNEGVSAADLALGVIVAVALLTDLVEGEKFGPLTDSIATANVDAEEGQRIQAALGVTITLPTVIQDDGDRPPRALAPLIVVQNGASRVYFWSPRTGAWVRVDNLTAVSEFPLTDSEGFAAMLAEELAPDFGGIDALAPRVMKQAAQARTKLSLRMGDAAGTTELTYF